MGLLTLGRVLTADKGAVYALLPIKLEVRHHEILVCTELQSLYPGQHRGGSSMETGHTLPSTLLEKYRAHTTEATTRRVNRQTVGAVSASR